MWPAATWASRWTGRPNPNPHPNPNPYPDPDPDPGPDPDPDPSPNPPRWTGRDTSSVARPRAGRCSSGGSCAPPTGRWWPCRTGTGTACWQLAGASTWRAGWRRSSTARSPRGRSSREISISREIARRSPETPAARDEPRRAGDEGGGARPRVKVEGAVSLLCFV